MAGPTFNTLMGANANMQARINEFYNFASIFPSHRYFVGLFGEYVEEAISTMDYESKKNPANDSAKTWQGNKVYERSFNRWKSHHVPPLTSKNGKPDEVELKWTTSNVTVPTVQTQSVNDITIDTTKSINYPLLTKHEPTGTISLTIVEDRNMMMYQFFNALLNKFFEPKILKPKSSFHKLAMYVVVLNGDVLGGNPQQFTNPKQSTTPANSRSNLDKFNQDPKNEFDIRIESHDQWRARTDDGRKAAVLADSIPTAAEIQAAKAADNARINSASSISQFGFDVNAAEATKPVKPLTLEEVPFQVFEFNSILIKGISGIELSQEIGNKKIEFTVTFEAPNLFQGSFKNTSLRNLRDNSSDKVLHIKGVDGKASINDDGSYNEGAFVLSEKELNSKQNNGEVAN